MADTNCTEQFTALGTFTLGYVVNGVYYEKETPYISEKQRDILEARAAHQPFDRHCDCFRPEGCAKCIHAAEQTAPMLKRMAKAVGTLCLLFAICLVAIPGRAQEPYAFPRQRQQTCIKPFADTYYLSTVCGIHKPNKKELRALAAHDATYDVNGFTREQKITACEGIKSDYCAAPWVSKVDGK